MYRVKSIRFTKTTRKMLKASIKREINRERVLDTINSGAGSYYDAITYFNPVEFEVTISASFEYLDQATGIAEPYSDVQNWSDDVLATLEKKFGSGNVRVTDRSQGSDDLEATFRITIDRSLR